MIPLTPSPATPIMVPDVQGPHSLDRKGGSGGAHRKDISFQFVGTNERVSFKTNI